jgi:hypothetical protein
MPDKGHFFLLITFRLLPLFHPNLGIRLTHNQKLCSMKQSLQTVKSVLFGAGLVAFSAASYAQIQTDSLNFTGGIQTYTVPCGVTSINIEAYGAQGGTGATGGNASTGGFGGLGGYASGTLDVTPGQVLNIFVGGAGTTLAGFNGGGNGGSQNAGAGGGATDVRMNGTNASDRILVAGGGGGGGRAGCEAANVAGGNGGSGGGVAGQDGTAAATSGGFAGGGFGGTVGAGGAAGIGCSGFLGAPGSTSTNENGANGGAGQSCCCFSLGSIPGGGGGGGGYIGGSGGGGGSAGTTGCSGNDKGAGGGGAGGSSYNGGMTVAGTVTNGIRTGNGVVIISYNDPTPVASLVTPAIEICVNDTVYFTATSTNNPTSYTWTVGGDLQLVNGQGTATVGITSTGTSGTIAVSATNVCATGPASADHTVQVNALPVVTASVSPATICAGDTAIIDANGALVFTWSNGGSNGDIVTSFSTTTYTVTGVDANGCSNSASAVLTVNQLPTVQMTGTLEGTVCGGQDITLTGTPSGGTYNMTIGDPASLTGNVFNPSATGDYTVTYTYSDGNGCTAAADLNYTVDCMVGLEMIGSNGSINVYPNPATTQFTIASNTAITGMVELFDEAGKLVLSQKVTQLKSKQIDVKQLPAGTYNLKISNGEAVFSGKLNVIK